MALILVGRSASGKDTIRKELIKMGMESVISYTTRPPRPNEVNHVDYHFVSEEEFNQQTLFGIRQYKVASGEIWKYGFKIEDLNSNSVLIIDPYGLRDLKDSGKVPLCSFYIKVAEDVLKQRSLDRGGDIDEINRRIAADNKDFFFIEPRTTFSINNTQGDVNIVAKCIYILYQNYIIGGGNA